jgi:hypothetical protein
MHNISLWMIIAFPHSMFLKKFPKGIVLLKQASERILYIMLSMSNISIYLDKDHISVSGRMYDDTEYVKYFFQIYDKSSIIGPM